MVQVLCVLRRQTGDGDAGQTVASMARSYRLNVSALSKCARSVRMNVGVRHHRKQLIDAPQCHERPARRYSQQPARASLQSGPTALPAIRGEIVLEHATFRYRIDGPEVLHDISFNVPAGQIVGIVRSLERELGAKRFAGLAWFTSWKRHKLASVRPCHGVKGRRRVCDRIGRCLQLWSAV